MINRHARHAAAVIAVGTIFGITSCAGNGEDEPSAQPTASDSPANQQSPENTFPASPPASASLSADERTVLTAYRNAWAAQNEAYAKANSKGTALHDHVTLKALGDIEATLREMRQNGYVMVGDATTTDLKVKSINKEPNPPKARIEACVDVEPWKLREKKTKKNIPFPSERLTKYVSQIDLEHWGKSGWMVTDTTPEEREC